MLSSNSSTRSSLNGDEPLPIVLPTPGTTPTNCNQPTSPPNPFHTLLGRSASAHSRSNSSNRSQSTAPLTTTSDDDDDEGEDSDGQGKCSGSSSAGSNYKERRREAHTMAEQKRRDAIKRGYSDLQTIVPACRQQDTVSSYKLSKAAILQRSIEYIQQLQTQKLKREKELQQLRKEVMGLDIMKYKYQEMVQQQHNPIDQLTTPPSSQPTRMQSLSSDKPAPYLSQHLPPPPPPSAPTHLLSSTSAPPPPTVLNDEIKLEVFKALCDSLFLSFDASVSVSDFNELSGCTISWLEEHCKPQNLQHISANILEQLKNQITWFHSFLYNHFVYKQYKIKFITFQSLLILSIA